MVRCKNNCVHTLSQIINLCVFSKSRQYYLNGKRQFALEQAVSKSALSLKIWEHTLGPILTI